MQYRGTKEIKDIYVQLQADQAKSMQKAMYVYTVL